ncbi:MAG: sugar phosphate isomerase/epimerase [Candidatus Marinimicrobia bacterium]|nr:sugar phosphate isomerase/epimerase [Candidatus Neomarinimicrobiota bacterium]
MKHLRLGGHIPWLEIDKHLQRVLDLGLAPEIAIKGPEFDTLDEKLLDQIGQKLAEAKVRPTVHAPFFDLNPGALDPLIRKATYQRLSQSLAAATHLNAHLMVIHPGFDKWRYPNLDQVWLALAKDFFPPLLERAAACSCRLAIENIYEEAPDTLVQLVDEIDSQWFGHCFDAGHWHLFGKRSMTEWLDAIGPRLFHLHLHDNHGRADEHLPVGDGTINFTPLKLHLRKMSTLPSMTLEAHSEEHLIRSLQQVRNLLV